jgi:SAM-dependent methyltransferase
MEGLFSKENVESIRSSPEFVQNEKASNIFLVENLTNMLEYGKKWVVDPFHAWSRQFEYPWVTQQFKQIVEKSSGPLNVMDAGSGYTYFPYFLLGNILPKESTICAVDYDLWLKNFFDKTIDPCKNQVQFEYKNLTDISDDSKFDIIYSISTLEHSAHSLLSNLTRLYNALKPGGYLVITMDISLDGNADIDINKFRSIWSTVKNNWSFDNYDENPLLSINTSTDDSNIFTYLDAIQSYATRETMGPLYYKLSIFGFVLQKKN